MATTVLFYASIVLIILICLSATFTLPQFIKFIQCTNINSNHPFFQHRPSTANTLYISGFIFALYIVNPLTLILINVPNLNQSIPLFINDIANNVLFLLFFTRMWVLCFDTHFIAMLQNWTWRREINARECESNVIIKYRNILSTHRRTIATLSYSTLVTPLCLALLLLSDSAMIHHILYRSVYTFLCLALLAVTYCFIHKLSIVTDEHSIRSELLLCMRTSAVLYTLSHISYILLCALNADQSTAMWLEILLISAAHSSVIYVSVYWCRQRFICEAMSALNGTKRSQNQSFLTTFSDTHKMTFEDVMSHRAGIEAFCRHLAREFGLESILFIIEVCQFKAKTHALYRSFTENIPFHSHSDIFALSNVLNAHWLPIDQRMLNHSPYQIALYLYDKYIEHSADLCVNISSINRREMYRNFKYLAQELSETNVKESEHKIVITLYKLFDNAYREIWHLIQTDTFIRFKSTDAFPKLIHVLYPTQARQALSQAKNPKNKMSKIMVASVTPTPNCNECEDSHSPSNKEQKSKKNTRLRLTRSQSDPVRVSQTLDLQILAKTERHSENPFLTNPIHAQHSANTMKVLEFLQSVIVPPAMLKSAAKFWKTYVNTLPKSETLEIGMSIYFSMFAHDRSMQSFFRKSHQTHTQKQIEILSLKLLNMISWLIQLLWDRNHSKLNVAMTKLGTLHMKFNIKSKHFSVMLQAFDETFEHYFPLKYRNQERHCFDYIFAYAAHLMMKEPLSDRCGNKAYYKTLELKFNSERKCNEYRIPKDARQLSRNTVSNPVKLGRDSKFSALNSEYSSVSCFTLKHGKSLQDMNRRVRRTSSPSVLVSMNEKNLVLINNPSLSANLIE